VVINLIEYLSFELVFYCSFAGGSMVSHFSIEVFFFFYFGFFE